MEYIEYEFKKGELNKFNNLNQDLKTIFTEYVLDNNGRIYGTPILQKGKHIAQTDYRFPIQCDSNKAFMLDSKSIFDYIKENKKNIKSIVIESNKFIYLKSDKLRLLIGKLVNIDPINYNIFNSINYNIISQNTIYHTNVNDKSIIELDEDDIINLVGNGYINIVKDDYKTRITKEVIPGLKKSHTISLDLYKHKTYKTLFHLLILVYRGSCTSFHIYTCLKV